MRNTYTRVLAGTALLALAACSSKSTTPAGSAPVTSASGSSSVSSSGNGGAGGTIGVAMPTKTSERWIADGDNIKKQLEAAGYQVDLEYGDDKIPNQVSQIENMVTKGEKALVIAAIDGKSLVDVLNKAKAANIPVIAYDRLIRDTDAVSYYATFDNFKVGVLQAQSIVDRLTGAGPFNIELFAGSPDDNNAKFFFDGAMSVLQPLITSGKYKVLSGQTAYAQVGTLRWDGAVAQKRMEDIISKAYSNGAKVDAVLSPYDGLSRGIIAALQSAGYGSAAKPLPVVSGQDAEVASVKMIIAGTQATTIYKDTRELAKVAVKMVQAVTTGGTPETNDTKTYDNGKKIVPSMLLVPVEVDKSNYQKILIDGGYYTADQLK